LLWRWPARTARRQFEQRCGIRRHVHTAGIGLRGQFNFDIGAYLDSNGHRLALLGSV